ncbi:hypothetical protein DRO54_08470 [Candidatus Bathyarchaeota archaeon]|nr:MAG: hypothetical protein DRO54_08470 [Candidatus Bathyarchaeota archaeon]
MPIIRKVIELGNSKVVALPKSWVNFYEQEAGVRVELVAIEVNEELKIRPYIPKKKMTEKRGG